jgi:hypothetical protein
MALDAKTFLLKFTTVSHHVNGLTFSPSQRTALDCANVITRSLLVTKGTKCMPTPSLIKLCECGCGQPAPIAKMTKASKGHVKGQPVRFVQGHGRLRHGMCRNGKVTPEWFAYNSAEQRCNNRNTKRYMDYGGRGIEFRFTSFEAFYAELGQRPSDAHSLDRRNNDGHYEPGNVRWATDQEQALNRRSTRKAA